MKGKKKFWKYPWGYGESLFVAVVLLFVGVFLDLILGVKPLNLAYPINIILLILFIVESVTAFVFSKRIKMLRWLYSIEATIASICLFTVITMIIALVPEESLVSIGFVSFKMSFTVVISYTFLMFILCSTILKRIKIKSTADVFFQLNHLGLLIALIAMGFGATDLKDMRMAVKAGDTVWYAMDSKGDTYDLDFALQLNEFKIDFYQSKFGIIDLITGELLEKNTKPLLVDLALNDSLVFDDYSFILINYKPAPKFNPKLGMNTLKPAKAEILVKKNSLLIDTVLINHSNKFYQNNDYKFENKFAFVMTEPEPSLFESDVKIYVKKGDTLRAKIGVNYPMTIEHYKIYQSSYEKTATGYISLFSIIYEPWLIYVYIGCIMMIFGAMYLVFARNNLEGK
jgi:hypothetical protein